MHRIPSDWRPWLILGLFVVVACSVTQVLVVQFGPWCATAVPATLLALAMASWIRKHHNRFERYLADDEAEPDNVYHLPTPPPRLVDRTTDPPDDPSNDAA